MPSKLSIHLSGYPERAFDILERMRPSIVKVFNFPSEMNIDAIRARSPGTLVIYRQYTNLDYHAPADLFFAEIADSLSKLRGRGILWEGINEPIVNSVQDAQAINAWYLRFAELMHAEGEKVAGFCWSTGNPVRLDEVVPHIVEAAAAVDVHALHEYYSLWGAEHDWARYREFEAALPTYAQKPVVITEAGLDDNGDAYTGGYRTKKSAQEYLELLKAYDALLMEDPYVLGATIYQWGDWNWPSFELDPVIDLLAEYVASVGGGAAIPSPWPVLSPSAPIYAFSATPRTITPGQSATLQWDVEGVKAIYLNGQGVTGRETRTVQPAHTTTYVLQVVFQDDSTTDLYATVAVTEPPPAPTYSFSVTPENITAGESATLRWDVEGVRSVYLDGEGVTGHEVRTVSPTETTTYILRVVLPDDSSQELTATVTVTPSSVLEFEWDPRLDELGVHLERSDAPNAWRLVSATYLDRDAAGGKHHILFKALRGDGRPASNVQFVVDWVERDPSDAPAVVATDLQGAAECALWASMDPALRDGIYFTLPKDEPGDAVSGLGLPWGDRVSFALTYQYH